MSKNLSGLEGPDISVIQNVNWDPMEVLHTADGKIEGDLKDTFESKANSGKSDTKTDDTDSGKDDTDKGKTKTTEKQGPDLEKFDLTDELLQQGLSRVSGYKPKNDKTQAPSTPADDSKDDDKKDEGASNLSTVDMDNAFALHYKLLVEGGEWKELDDWDNKNPKESYLRAKEANLQRIREEEADALINEVFEKNPDGKVMGKKLLQHLANGGRVSDFVNLTAPQEVDFKELDNEDEEVAEDMARTVINNYYSSIGWSKTEIDKKILNLKKTGGLLDEARGLEQPYTKSVTERETQHQQWLADQKKLHEDNAKKINTGLNALIDKGHTFGPIKVAASKQEREELRSYFFETDEKGVNGFSAELQDNLRDPEFLLFLAKVGKDKLYKKLDTLVGAAKGKDQAMDELESKLGSALLNKKLENNSAQSGTDSGTGKGNSKHEFNLDEATVIQLP